MKEGEGNEVDFIIINLSYLAPGLSREEWEGIKEWERESRKIKRMNLEKEKYENEEKEEND
jgi:hypothetical protein